MTKVFIATPLLWLNIIAAASAGLLTNTVTAEWFYPGPVSTIETHSFVVGPGVELPAVTIQNDRKFDIDLGDDFVLFSFNAVSNWSNTSANGWEFTDTNGTIPQITGYTIGATTGGVTGLDATDLSFNADSVFGNFKGVVAPSGSTIRLDIEFIPEPSTAILATLGLTLLVSRRRR